MTNPGSNHHPTLSHQSNKIHGIENISLLLHVLTKITKVRISRISLSLSFHTVSRVMMFEKIIRLALSRQWVITFEMATKLLYIQLPYVDNIFPCKFLRAALFYMYYGTWPRWLLMLVSTPLSQGQYGRDHADDNFKSIFWQTLCWISFFGVLLMITQQWFR